MKITPAAALRVRAERMVTSIAVSSLVARGGLQILGALAALGQSSQVFDLIPS